MNARSVHLTPRLTAALELLNGSTCVADIGTDHGRLAAALLQQNICERVIASDVSEPSLRKAEALLSYIGLSDRVSVRCGDGLSVLEPGECDAVALLGMGGTLMCRLLDACDVPLMGANAVVLQPMRAQREIREYLYRHCFHITDDRIVREGNRLYQVLRAVLIDTVQEWPEHFPQGFFDVGYTAFERREANLYALCIQQREQHVKRLKTARNTDGEARLADRIRALDQILKELEPEE